MEQHKNQQNQPEDNYPGYPHYPAGEDITNPANGRRKVPIDGADHTKPEKGTEPEAADITPEEVKDLTNSFQNRDYIQGDVSESRLDQTDDDGDALNETTEPGRDPGFDLDVPGNEDDASGAEGLADEENNYYSLGGDNHEDLEEDSDV